MNVMPVNNRFGVLLAERRMKEKRNISLYAWQNNTVDRFDVKVIEALCGYFGVPLSALLEYVPPEHDKKKVSK
jgi:DNA-binding Xre family transcriptional regulator